MVPTSVVVLLTLAVVSLFSGLSVDAVTVDQVGESGLYVITNTVYQSLFYVTPNGVLVVDAPRDFAAEGKTVPQIIADYTDQPIKWYVYSHHHSDHGDGVWDFDTEGVEFICHKKAKKAIRKWGYPECSTIIKETTVLEPASGYEVELANYGAIHTDGNLFIYFKSPKLLFVNDFIFPTWAPYFAYDFIPSFHLIDKAFKKIEKYDFDYYVGGHRDTIGTPEDVEVQKEFLADVRAATAEAMAAADWNAAVESVGGATDRNGWSQLAAYYAQITEACLETLLNENGWDTKLKDVAAFGESYCLMAYHEAAINY